MASIKELLSAFLVVVLSTFSYSQVSPNLVEMLAQYPDQEAVYIDITDSTAVTYDNRVYVYGRFFQSKAMVLRKGGGSISSAASPIISKDDQIQLTAYTISPEGDTINIKQEEMTLLELYGDKRRYVVYFPDARAGSVFCFKWQLDSSEPVFSGKRFLGRTYPVINNKTTISSPVDWVFEFAVSPNCLFTQQRSNEYLHSRELWVNHYWQAKSLPGLVFEDDSPPAAEFIPCLYYAFSYDRRWPAIENNKVDWTAIASAYDRHLRLLEGSNDQIKSQLQQILFGVSDRLGKINKIAEFVTANFQAMYSDIDVSASPGELLNRGSGSQAEAAYLLGAFLNEADIPHDFVLVSTRDNGDIIKALPALFYFNRLLIAAKVGVDTVWLDPFYRGTPLDVLPFEDQEVSGLVVGSNTKDFITTPISDYRENGHAIHLKITFDNKGGLTAEGVELLSGSLNIEEKRVLQKQSTQERFVRWSDFTARGLPGSTLKALDFSDAYSDINPFKVSYSLDAPNYIKREDSRIYIPLDILGRWKLGKLYSENRKLPIELGRPHSEQERITIELPADFKVEYLPENFSINSYLGEIFSVVVVTANTITITRGLSIRPYRLKADAAKSLNGFFSTAKDQADKYIILRK